jgi:hypothetical protein
MLLQVCPLRTRSTVLHDTPNLFESAVVVSSLFLISIT